MHSSLQPIYDVVRTYFDAFEDLHRRLPENPASANETGKWIGQSNRLFDEWIHFMIKGPERIQRAVRPLVPIVVVQRHDGTKLRARVHSVADAREVTCITVEQLECPNDKLEALFNAMDPLSDDETNPPTLEGCQERILDALRTAETSFLLREPRPDAVGIEAYKNGWIPNYGLRGWDIVSFFSGRWPIVDYRQIEDALFELEERGLISRNGPQRFINSEKQTTFRLTPAGALGAWSSDGKGTKFVVITDMDDSTRLNRELGNDEFNKVADAHRDRIRRVIKETKGFVSGSTGDGVIALFHTPENALGFACSIVEDAGHDRASVHCGIHHGVVEWKAGQIRQANAVNYATRVAEQAASMTILVSDRAYQLVLEGGCSRHGPLEWATMPCDDLKGFDPPHKLWIVKAPE